MLSRAKTQRQHADAVMELQRGIDRATHLVNQLFDLSRLEPRSSVRAVATTRLGEAVKMTVAQFVVQA